MRQGIQEAAWYRRAKSCAAKGEDRRRLAARYEPQGKGHGGGGQRIGTGPGVQNEALRNRSIRPALVSRRADRRQLSRRRSGQSYGTNCKTKIGRRSRKTDLEKRDPRAAGNKGELLDRGIRMYDSIVRGRASQRKRCRRYRVHRLYVQRRSSKK